MPNTKSSSRRAWMKTLSTSALLPAAMALDVTAQTPEPAHGPTTSTAADRERRLEWWHEARFGMFIHFGLYSQLSRHEWAMEQEGIPVAEYQLLAKSFNPKPHAARAWARLAKQAGMKYMVMTTKHHEGFCHFKTDSTNYCAPKQAAGRDLVAEYVEAARAEGMPVGFYYSLMDWHHPDGAKCATDEAARRRFVDYIHGHVHDLCSNYGKIAVMWYDVAWPLSAEQWESEKMNRMVRQLQPDILINNRSKIPEDFTTPEQRIQASSEPWEACMTMNDSWGYQRADDNWKSPKTIVKNLVTCARDRGNYLLNIGPKADGSIPEESIRILTAVGEWTKTNGDLIHQAEFCKVKHSEFANFTRRGNKLYVHVYYWNGSSFGIGGLKNKVLHASYYPNGQAISFKQDDFRVLLTGMPEKAPNSLVSVLELECDSEPQQDTENVRRNRPRLAVGV